LQGEVLDTKIDTSLAKLFESRRRRDIYLGFAEDPVGFLNTIIASQVRQRPALSCVCTAAMGMLCAMSVSQGGLGWAGLAARVCLC
jgi:hypothetical protein